MQQKPHLQKGHRANHCHVWYLCLCIILSIVCSSSAFIILFVPVRDACFSPFMWSAMQPPIDTGTSLLLFCQFHFTAIKILFISQRDDGFIQTHQDGTISRIKWIQRSWWVLWEANLYLNSCSNFRLGSWENSYKLVHFFGCCIPGPALCLVLDLSLCSHTTDVWISAVLF